MLQAAIILWRYRRIIQLILAALFNNRGLLAGLSDRPETSDATDARDIFRELDGTDYWDEVEKDLG